MFALYHLSDLNSVCNSIFSTQLFLLLFFLTIMRIVTHYFCGPAIINRLQSIKEVIRIQKHLTSITFVFYKQIQWILEPTLIWRERTILTTERGNMLLKGEGIVNPIPDSIFCMWLPHVENSEYKIWQPTFLSKN